MGKMLSFLAGVVVTVLVAVGAWLGLVYSGAINAAATDQHFDAVRWSLDTAMHRSVAARAEAAEVHESFTDAQVAAGAGHYAETCQQCHGGPGVEAAAWAQGMRPEPPALAEHAAEWSPAEIHWIVENGLKMTGMPAFGASHGEDDLLAITAFVSRLPGLSETEYAEMTGGPDGAEGGH